MIINLINNVVSEILLRSIIIIMERAYDNNHHQDNQIVVGIIAINLMFAFNADRLITTMLMPLQTFNLQSCAFAEVAACMCPAKTYHVLALILVEAEGITP